MTSPVTESVAGFSSPTLSPQQTAHKKMLLGRVMHAMIHRHAEKLEGIVKLGFGLDDFDHDDSAAPLPQLPGKDGKRKTKASQMSADDITRALRQNTDPYAIDSDGSVPKVFEHLPLRELEAALRFPDIFPDSFAKGALPSREVTLLRVANTDEHDHEEIDKSIKFVLRFFADALLPDGELVSSIQICTYEISNDRYRNGALAQFHKKIDDAIQRGRSIIAIAAEPADLSISGQNLIVRDLNWRPLSQETVINILRATHSVTDEVAEDELRARLPLDEALAVMPWAVIHHAFRGRTTLDVADRLREVKITPALAVSEPRITLGDVRGLPDLVRELTHIVEDVAEWGAGRLDWADVSSSLLLFGPPGTGKTMSAEALAGSMNAHFVQTSYADCQKAGHLGEYLKAMHEKVADAVNNAPSVFFIDELDSYGERNSRETRSDRYMHSVVNGLLETLTKLNDAEGVIVVAATNHRDTIDEALIRAGRFDQKIAVGFPDKQGAADILKSHIKDPDIDLSHISDQLIGLSGADLAATARAAKGRARRMRTPLDESHIAGALNSIAPPPSPENLIRKAWHEAGHVVVNHVVGLPPTVRVFIAPNGGGAFYQRPNTMTLHGAQQQLAVHLAGRAAEIVALGDACNGAGGHEASDLGQATGLALAVETELGLGAELIYAPVKPENWNQMDTQLRKRITAHLSQAQVTATDILEANFTTMERLAHALIARRELTQKDVLALLNGANVAQLSSQPIASSVPIDA